MIKIKYLMILIFLCGSALRGAAALKARPGRREKEEAGKQTLTIDGNKGNKGFEVDYRRYRALLEKGSELYVKSAGGKCAFTYFLSAPNISVKYVCLS